jgi:putative ABC transport system permease protein
MSTQLAGVLTEPLLLALIWGIFALGAFLSFRILSIADMSVEGVFPLAAVVALWALKAGWDPWAGFFFAILIGMLAGSLNGVLSRFLKIDSLLAGIIVMTALFSITVAISGGNISLPDGMATLFTPFESLFAFVGSGYWSRFCGDLLLLTLISGAAFIFVYWFFGTELGTAIRASGKNEQLAKAEGINVDFSIILGLAISSGLVAAAGALYGMRETFASSDLGKGTLVIGLTTVFLGEIIVPKLSFKAHLASLLVGGYVYWLIMSAISLIPGYNANFRYLIQAIFIAIAMLIPSFRKSLKERMGERRLAHAHRG